MKPTRILGLTRGGSPDAGVPTDAPLGPIVFRSSVGRGVLITAVLSGILSLLAMVALAGMSPVATALALMAYGSGIIWLVITTHYRIDDTHLSIRCGTRRWHLPFESITEVRMVHSVQAAPALSSDRLEIVCHGERVQISPSDRERFVQALVQRSRVTVSDPPEHIGGVNWFIVRFAISLITLGGVAAAAPIYVAISEPHVTIRGDDLHVNTWLYDATVNAAQIQAVSLNQTLPAAPRRIGGIAMGHALRGRFQLRGLGTGYIFAKTDTPPYIVVTTQDGFLVFNLATPSRTNEMYVAVKGLTQVR